MVFLVRIFCTCITHLIWLFVLTQPFNKKTIYIYTFKMTCIHVCYNTFKYQLHFLGGKGKCCATSFCGLIPFMNLL